MIISFLIERALKSLTISHSQFAEKEHDRSYVVDRLLGAGVLLPPEARLLHQLLARHVHVPLVPEPAHQPHRLLVRDVLPDPI